MTAQSTAALSPVLADLLGAASMVLVVGAAYLLVESLMLSVGRGRTAAAALLFVATTLFCRASSAMPRLGPDLRFTGGTRLLKAGYPYASVLLLAIGAVAEWRLMVGLVRARRGRITPASVKEAVDALPDGVCFSDADGVPLLQNAQMDVLAHDALGMALTDERTLWERLRAGACQGGYAVERTGGAVDEGVDDDGDDLLLVADDGRAWHLSRTVLSVEGEPVSETLASDVTEEYELVRLLEERNRRISLVNERMRAYGRDLARLTREEEVLAMKVRVHDEVGRAFVALRAYERQEPARRDREALLDLWRKVAHLLEDSETEETVPDDWTLLEQAAEAIGVSLLVSGELPAGADARRLAAMVVHECLNNAVRHGDAREVRVSCEASDGVVELVVTNNGMPPTAPVEEHGGLANLRSAVERAGGILNICWEPQVVVDARFDEEVRWQRHGSSSWMTSASPGSTSSSS